MTLIFGVLAAYSIRGIDDWSDWLARAIASPYTHLYFSDRT